MSKFRSPGKWAPARTNTIRGKIGPPIPMPDDDEFPIRTPGAGIATPVGVGSQEQSLGVRGSTATDRSVLQAGSAANDFADRAPSATAPPQPFEEAFRRRNESSALRDSMASGPSGSSIEKPRRGKKSLRSVLGRLFGKKRGEGSTSSDEKDRQSVALRTGQHRSDPTALSRSPGREISPQKRSASLPINEYNRALRSHSTVIEEFPQYDAHDTSRAPSQADTHTRPRGATTPSRLWTPNRAPGHADWTGLSPRPASSHARDSRAINGAEAEPAIGMALTSGSHPNRRSRSLGELREDASMPTIVRRRSDEIRYWRESYDPGILSPISSNKAEIEEPIILSDESEHLVEPEEPPQPFNFGPMGEMAGMKITQAASLETRVQKLEAKMQKLEMIVGRFHRGENADILRLQDPPKPNPTRLQRASFTRPATNHSETSLPKHENQEIHQPGQDSQSYARSTSHSRPSTVDTNASYQHSFDSSLLPPLPSSDAALVSSHNARPLSTSTTIRGAPSSSPTLPKDGLLTIEHYTALTNMIVAEQNARQNLESVVHRLQQQLISVLASYPTPDSSQVVNSVGGGFPAGEFSGFEQDDSDDEGHFGTEEFQTPNEERPSFGDDTFGNVMTDEGKRAPRTMSLSQITLKKGAQRV